MEKLYLNRVADMGCILCGSPAEIHHCRAGMGMGMRNKHIGGTIPLCPEHHRNGGYGIAIHAGIRGFEEMQDTTEAELLATVNGLLI